MLSQSVALWWNNTGRATRYSISAQAHLCIPIHLDTYFALDVDERKVQTSFNFDLMRDLAGGDACAPGHNAHSVEHILPKIALPIVQKSTKNALPIVPFG